MASATGSFRFLTKKSVSNMILTLYEGFFQINFRWLFKVVFLLRADYQAQIETQLSNKKFITIMASATGSFCFLTKKKVFITWFWLFTRGFFKTISDDFSKWYFCFNFLGVLKWTIFAKNDVSAGDGALSSLPVCFWKLHFSFHSAIEIVAFFGFFHFFSRSQIIRNCNFFNKKSEKWYFFLIVIFFF